jgi:hypothetical protein
MPPSSQGYLYIPRHRDKTPIWLKLPITLCAVGVAVLSVCAWYDYNKNLKLRHRCRISVSYLHQLCSRQMYLLLVCLSRLRFKQT